MSEDNANKVLLPVPCPQCGKETPVTGTMDGDGNIMEEIVETQCTHCQKKLQVNIKDALSASEEALQKDGTTRASEEEGVQEEDNIIRQAVFTITVENFANRLKATYSSTRYGSVIDAMLGMIDDFCLMTFSREMPPPAMKDLLVRSMIPVLYAPESLDTLIEYILQVKKALAAVEAEKAAEAENVLQIIPEGELHKV